MHTITIALKVYEVININIASSLFAGGALGRCVHSVMPSQELINFASVTLFGMILGFIYTQLPLRPIQSKWEEMKRYWPRTQVVLASGAGALVHFSNAAHKSNVSDTSVVAVLVLAHAGHLLIGMMCVFSCFFTARHIQREEEDGRMVRVISRIIEVDLDLSASESESDWRPPPTPKGTSDPRKEKELEKEMKELHFGQDEEGLCKADTVNEKNPERDFATPA